MKKHITLGILAMMMSTKAIRVANSAEETNLSHAERNTLTGAMENIANKIQQRGELAYISIARQLELLQALSQFELGRFLLQRVLNS